MMAHSAIISLSVVQAVEPPSRPQPFYETTRNNCRKRIYESVKPRQHYHLEYQLTPEPKHVYHTDIVAYGIVAKIYTKNDERVINTWIEDGLTYYGWKHYHKISLTTESLLDLFKHTVTVRVWNTKDRLSSRAKYDRPKAFRLPVPKSADSGNAEDATNSGSRRPSHMPGVHHDLSLNKRSRRKIRKRTSDTVESIESEGESQESLHESLISPRKSLKIPDQIKEDEAHEPPESGFIINPLFYNTSAKDRTTSASNSVSHSTESSFQNAGLKGLIKAEIKRKQEDAHAKAQMDKEGFIQLSIKLADLFASRDSLTVSVKDEDSEMKYFEISMHFETPLMSDWQRQLLNPMTFTVNSCSSLPFLPPEETEKYNPVHVSYKFYECPKIRTPALPYSSDLCWDFSTVVLLGCFKPELLLEYLRGPPLVLELHDRDVKNTSDKEIPKRAVFGQLQYDRILGNCNYSKALDTVETPSLFPEARLDLSCLLSGIKTIEFSLPIYKPPVETANSNKNDYALCGSQLSVTIELSNVLNFPSLVLDNADSILSQRPSTPFGRLVFIVSTENKALIDLLIEMIDDINANGLGLKDLPVDLLNATLSTYKLTDEQISSPHCDVVTGFHIEDSIKHMFILEGLHWKGIQKIWNKIPHHHSEDPSVFKCYYNSDYTFSSRLYGSLDVDLIHIKLPYSTDKFIKQSTKHYMPRLCLQMLIILNELQDMEDLCSVTRNCMFPSVDKITALSLYCSQHSFASSQPDHKSSVMAEQKLPVLLNRRRTKSMEPLDNMNIRYERLKKEQQKLPPVNAMLRNISKVYELSQQSKNARQRSTSEGNYSPFLYSSQTFNSATASKAALRQKLDVHCRFTYSQQYHHRTVEPVDGDVELKNYLKRDDGGYQSVWGKKTSLDDNKHPKRPDTARISEIKKPFVDNILHSNTLKPTVDWERYSWNNRGRDFELYKAAPVDFGSSQPVTIHLAGESKHNELKLHKEQEEEKWNRKIVVNDKQFYTFRKGNRTEMSVKGPLASTQLDKLQGLLKDPPMRLSYIPSENLRIDTLPCLNVIPNRVRDNDIVGYFPADTQYLSESLKKDTNVIPIHKSLTLH